MKVNQEQLFGNIVSHITKYGAKKIAVFGSCARGEEKPACDIEILVEFPGIKSLLEHVKIDWELSEALGIIVKNHCFWAMINSTTIRRGGISKFIS